MSTHEGINAALLNMCARAQPTIPNAGSSSQLSVSNAVNEAELPRELKPVPRPPEEYQWLQEALASVEPTERKILRLLQTVETADDVSSEEYIAAVEELGELVEDINWAREYMLMDGPSRILLVLKGKRQLELETEARDALLMVIAHSAQLNDDIQKKYAEAHWEEYLLPLLQQLLDSGSPSLAAALHACSCLCRSCQYNTITFINHGGLNILTAILNSGLAAEDNKISEKVICRTIFFVGSLAEFGVSSEGLITLVCSHLAATTSLILQASGAQALVELASKSLKTVRAISEKNIGDKLAKWKLLPDASDARKELATMLCQ